jgi:hypothetical protein
MNTSRTLYVVALITALVATAACAGNSASDNAGSSASAPAGQITGTGSAPPNSAETVAKDGLKVIVTTTLALSVESIGESYSRVTQIARSAGGYVAASNVESGDQGRASIELRVPASQLDAVVADLKALTGSRVDTENVASKEVTTEYTDLQSRLRNLERTEAQYQQLLAQAKTIDEVLNVNNRLLATREEIEKTTGRIRLFDDQVEYATVKLQLATFPATKATGDYTPNPLRVLAGAWDASVHLFWVVLSAGAIFLVALPWLALLVAVVLLAGRVYRRVAPLLDRLRA